MRKCYRVRCNVTLEWDDNDHPPSADEVRAWVVACIKNNMDFLMVTSRKYNSQLFGWGDERLAPCAKCGGYTWRRDEDGCLYCYAKSRVTLKEVKAQLGERPRTIGKLD